MGMRARMAMSLEWFCSWTIMQDLAQQVTQKNTFFAWDGRHWITQPTSCPMPDLAPSDIHLSSALKLTPSGRHFRSNEEVQQAVMNFLHSLGTHFCQNGVLKLIFGPKHV
ncbi:hypothetical protein AVEN_218145-1 [Araneus ventricosus]|uniref:Uncharacterized protein n=1 Tax=Araneus ventricosus TaxID=182803 RepID=A0A4Y2KY92_ARAVE|nr:hypothetical protein AVEN_218145-1 [Araneus ventricosus]